MTRHRVLTAALGLAAFAVLASCGDGSSPTADGVDRSAPRVLLARVPGAPDSVLSFTVDVADNLGIKSIHVVLSGGLSAVFDTTFNTAQTHVVLPFNIIVPKSVPFGTHVTVTASAFDGAGNASITQTLALSVGQVTSAVIITSPAAGTPVIVGKSIVVAVSAKSNVKVRAIGLIVSGLLSRRDSVLFTSPLRDSATFADTISIPSTSGIGRLTLTPFLIDSLGQRTEGTPFGLDVTTSSSTRPTLIRGHSTRIEVTDTLHVEGTAPAGVTRLGYQILNLATNAIIIGDSISSSGNITSLIKTFNLRLPITQFPTQVKILSFATDANGTRVQVIDTVTVVAGVTRALPLGGVIADAIYHPRSNAIYLSNIERNQLEVFSLADSSFHNPIVTGSRPWGISAWPRDRLGTMGDTLLVANSGGTEISYVNTVSQSEVSRYYLPNIVAYSVTTVLSATTGQPIPQRTVYDFSDRPQYLATTCQSTDTLPGRPCGDVVVVYSTTPTGGQGIPFPNKGTVRYENLTRRTSHFFFEQAVGQTQGRLDTLEVERYQSQGFGSDSTLVPSIIVDTVIAGGIPRQVTGAIVVDVPRMGFRDTTYVRNSGNFRRATIGEGGVVLGSRAMGFDVTTGLVSILLTSPTGFSKASKIPIIDAGVSRAFDVSDYVANTFAKVQGVAINFDGALAAIRADSTYIINPTLRLLGLLQTTNGGNAGFDFHPNNTGIRSVPLSSRLAFAASTLPVIEIYDTWCYRKVGEIPTRDPVIGPIKAAIRTTGEIVLVGATQFGVVIATLPNSFTTTCS
ncbi:MAG: hypothetical protein M3081_05730 [Gemmatimonadota bacterium]|nr:hypothetical protein [Gemmatimonadota bacterium]